MPHPSLTLVADAGDSQTIYNAVGVASWKKRVVHCEIKKYGSSPRWAGERFNEVT
jgi:hypothetical protein